MGLEKVFALLNSKHSNKVLAVLCLLGLIYSVLRLSFLGVFGFGFASCYAFGLIGGFKVPNANASTVAQENAPEQ